LFHDVYLKIFQYLIEIWFEIPHALAISVPAGTIDGNMGHALRKRGPFVCVVLRGESPWWLATDVCAVLGIANSRDAISRLDSDERNCVALNDGKRGNPRRIIISEPGLYSLVLRSRRPGADGKNFLTLCEEKRGTPRRISVSEAGLAGQGPMPFGV